MRGKANLETLVWYALLLLGAACPASAGRIIYVDVDATGANNGKSWDNAYIYLQDALADANSAEKPVELRVAQGIYRPNEGLIAVPEFDLRTTTFQLINSVTIKGGFAGVGGVDPNERNTERYKTILSGDLNGDDVGVTDLYDLASESTQSENSYHVVTCSGTDETAVLDGLTITGGNASEPSRKDSGNGGGIYNDISRPTLINCTISGNQGYFGGGMYNYDSRPTLTNCTISGNQGYYGGGMDNYGSSMILTNCTISGNRGHYGGGMYNSYNRPTLISCTFSGNSAVCGGGMFNSPSSPILTNCTFSGNRGHYDGGGMYNQVSSPKFASCTFRGNSAVCGGGMFNSLSSQTLTNCTFSGNRSYNDGGGMDNHVSSPRLANCVFSGNFAGDTGGGMRNCGRSQTLTNCTFTQNSAQNGKALACNCCEGICALSNVQLINCILWDGGNEIWNNDGSTIEISNSNIQGVQTGVYDLCEAVILGEGNIDTDPLFADPGYWDPNGTKEDANDDFWVDGDYHLMSQAGRWTPISQTWVQDDVTSPCIDFGNIDSAIGFEPFPNGGIVNMGAYGGTAEASKTYFGEPVCETIIAGDINGDCKIDLADFQIMAHHWLEGNIPVPLPPPSPQPPRRR